jgi:mono/diheme cytochrome c family protein
MTTTFLLVSLLSQQQQTQDPLIRSIEGKDLFASYCASCHGMDAKGSGPASAAMKTKPPDLTLIAKRNRGKFPAAKVEQLITGDQMKASHGSTGMPIWGPVFHRVERDQDMGLLRINNVMRYLESIQAATKK